MAQDYVLLTASASARELGFLVPPSDATKGRIPLSPRGEFLLPPLGDWRKLPAYINAVNAVIAENANNGMSERGFDRQKNKFALRIQSVTIARNELDHHQRRR
jgi:hypothetical protein